MNEERSFLWLDETKILFPSMMKKLKVKVEEKEYYSIDINGATQEYMSTCLL